jgi:hypothetical protein
VIDATANSGQSVYATRDIKGTDFTAPDAYQDFSVSFTMPSTLPENWEFRVKFTGVADLSVDVIRVQLQPRSTYVIGPLSDGSDVTKWWSQEHADADTTEWAGIYLGSTAVEVSNLTVTSGAATAAGMPTDFQLQYSSDGSTWATIPGQSYTSYAFSAGANSFEFGPVLCKYLRVYATKLGQDTDGKYRMILAGMDVVSKVQTAQPTLDWNYTYPASGYTVMLSPVAHFPEEQTIRVSGITSSEYTPTVPLAQGTCIGPRKLRTPPDTTAGISAQSNSTSVSFPIPNSTRALH